MSETNGGAARLRRAWLANLRRRSEVSWGGFAVEMAVVGALNGVLAVVLVFSGNRDKLPALAVVCVGFIAGFTVLRLALLAIFRPRRDRPGSGGS